MNKNIPETKATQEVDLMQIFNAIGKLFERLYNFIASIFKGLLNVIVFILKVVFKNIIIISIVVLISGVIGYAVEKYKPARYKSSMLVRPYFDSKYQLVTNIDYYNALIGNKDYKTLSTIFQQDEDAVRQLKSFSISPGPETENDRIRQYETFIKSLDSTRASEIEFDEYVENRSIYSGNLFQISVTSYKKDIFQHIEKEINKAFTNEYSLKKMAKRDSMITIQKENILASINDLQELQKVYVTVLEAESKSQSNINFNTGFPLKQEKSITKEFELFNQELKLRKQLSSLEEQKIEEDVFFDTIASFQKIGTRSSPLIERYSLLFPVASFLLLVILFLIFRTIKFVNSYEE